MALLPFTRTPLQQALQRFVDGEDLEQVLEPLDDAAITSKHDAAAVVDALRHVPRVPQRPEERYRTSPLQTLIALFQDVEDERAAEVLRESGAPELVRIFRASFPPHEDDHDDLLFLLKILMMYRVAEAAELVVQAARHPATCDAFLWSVVLGQLEGDPALADEVVAGLTEPLPEGFAGVAFLDLANQRARDGHTLPHPFDTAPGLQRLEAYLADPSPEHASYAHSAAAAIPFLRTPARQRLLDLAAQHRDPAVRLESHWAAATLGDERAVAALAEASRDPRQGTRALAYLEELGRLDAAPPESQTDEHLALATLADWLAYPTEYDAFPDALRVVDTREMFWPPTNDRRRLWLIEFTYEPSDERPEPEVGIGMVGSITFALAGETSPDMPVDDLYALHCVWELQANDDERAPDELSAEAGRALLSRGQ
jgi:hypothetical protein